jgi:phosphoadenosine phosphosulfate reductase
MPRDTALAPVTERVAALNARYRHHAASAVLGHALDDPQVGRVALVSSFGAESVVLLHLISVMAPATPVLFIDTMMLFEETLDYQREVSSRLGLTDVRVIRAHGTALAAHDPERNLHATDPDACCALRKTAPLEAALAGFDAWITGRKRFHGAARADLDFFEAETGRERIKINPLAHWARADLLDYIDNNALPRHPLVAHGYPSIGCAPCTAPVAGDAADPRAGRWPGQDKTECGIHFEGGRVLRASRSGQPSQEEEAA